MQATRVCTSPHCLHQKKGCICCELYPRRMSLWCLEELKELAVQLAGCDWRSGGTQGMKG